MPATVFHNLTATTPDDPTYEIRPSHWNSAHAVSLNLVGTDIIGAFSNDPAVNVSFSTNAGGFVIASANVTAAPSPVNVTGANGSSVNAQTIAFSNANGMTMGVSTAANGATVTGSYTVPTQTAFVLSNSNGISFGTNGSTVTASYTVPSQTVQPVAFSASGGSSAFSTLVFSNGSGVTFSNSNGSLMATVVTSYRASNDAVGLNTAQSNVTWTVNSSGISVDARGYAGTTTGFTGANISGSMTHNSVGLALSLSVAAPGGGGFTGGVSTGGNTSGQTGTQTGQIVFAGGNNITLSVATAAGGNQTVTISGANAGGAQTGISSLIAGQSQTVGALSFSNANGVSFGIASGANTGTLTASVAAQSNQTAGIYASSQTFGQSSSSTYDARSLSIVGSGDISVGWSNSSLVVSGSTYPAQSNQSLAIYNSSQTTGASSSSTYDARSLSIAYSGNISGGWTNGSLLLTVATQTAQTQSNVQGIIVSNTTYTTGNVSFSNVNGISFGSSAGQAITASYTVPTVTQYFSNTGTTFNGANVSGSLTLNTNGLQVSLSAAAPGGGGAINVTVAGSSQNAQTLMFSNLNGVTFGLNGSTITASVAAGGSTLSVYEPPMRGQTTAQTMNNGNWYLQPFFVSTPVTAYRMAVLQNLTTQSASTWSISASVSAGNASSMTGSWGVSGSYALFSRQSTGTAANSSNLISFYSNTSSYSAGISESVSWSTNVSSATVSLTTSIALGYIANIDSVGGVTTSSQTATGSTTFSSTSTNANSFSSSFNNSQVSAWLSGVRPQHIPFATSLPVGEYWLGLRNSTNTGTTNDSRMMRLVNMGGPQIVAFTTNTSPYAEIGNSVSIASSNLTQGWGSGTVDGSTSTTFAMSNISNMSQYQTYFMMAARTY